MSLRFTKILLFSWVISFSARGVEVGEYATVSGFVASGFSYDLNNRDDNYEPLIESGLRSSLYLPHNLMLNGQLLYKDVFVDEQVSDEFQIDYLTMDWNTLGPWNSEKTLSLGRFKASNGIYGNTIDVPFTRPSLVLAQSVYPNQFRALLSNLDGALISSNLIIGDGDLTAELGYGRHNQNEDLNLLIANRVKTRATLDMDYGVFADLKYRTTHWLYAFSYRHMRSDYQVQASSGIPNISGELRTEAYIAGIQYQQQALEFTVEGILMHNIYSGENALINSADDRVKGIYGQVRYFVQPDVALMLRYDTIKYSVNNPSGIDVSWLDDYYTWSTGVTWNISESWQLALEVHRRIQDHRTKTTTIGQVAWRF